mmetsp:Transcript_21880/g.70482  ORF Transcript_21880/g.70482 Transcript_21880/m.70482 type:complete len:273 (+) Transcript_21880:268-1086(+)
MTQGRFSDIQPRSMPTQLASCCCSRKRKKGPTRDAPETTRGTIALGGQRATLEEPLARRLVRHHLLGPVLDDRLDLGRHAVLGRLALRALAHHPAREDEWEGHQRANLELGLVLLHPREARVLEDLRPLLLRGLEATVLRDLAHAPLVVRLHLGEVQEEHVGLVAERPPAVDEAEEEHRQQPTRRHDLRRHVWEAGQHALVEEGLERRLQELLAHLRLAPVLERLWVVRLDERLEGDDRLLRVAHHHDVLQVLTVGGEAPHLGQRRALRSGR